MEAPPSIRQFVRAMFAQWFTAMSGPISVPAAIAAFFVTNEVAQVLLSLTAIASFGFTGYWVWRIERNKLITAQQSLAHAQPKPPSLELVFDKALPGCFEITGTVPERCLTVRVLPRTDSRVNGCIGQLLKISMSMDCVVWADTHYCDALDLRWTHGKDERPPVPRRITKGVQQYLDVFYIGEKEKKLHTSTTHWPRPLPNFTGGEWYKFDVRVCGDDDVEAVISLRVKFTGAWNNQTVKEA